MLPSENRCGEWRCQRGEPGIWARPPAERGFLHCSAWSTKVVLHLQKSQPSGECASSCGFAVFWCTTSKSQAHGWRWMLDEYKEAKCHYGFYYKRLVNISPDVCITNFRSLNSYRMSARGQTCYDVSNRNQQLCTTSLRVFHFISTSMFLREGVCYSEAKDKLIPLWNGSLPFLGLSPGCRRYTGSLPLSLLPLRARFIASPDICLAPPHTLLPPASEQGQWER